MQDIHAFTIENKEVTTSRVETNGPQSFSYHTNNIFFRFVSVLLINIGGYVVRFIHTASQLIFQSFNCEALLFFNLIGDLLDLFSNCLLLLFDKVFANEFYLLFRFHLIALNQNNVNHDSKYCDEHCWCISDNIQQFSII